MNISEGERGLIITLPTVHFDFDSSNLKASSRDKIAVKELAFTNIDKTRISPVTDNSTSPGRQTNRPVEIVVLNP